MNTARLICECPDKGYMSLDHACDKCPNKTPASEIGQITQVASESAGADAPRSQRGGGMAPEVASASGMESNRGGERPPSATPCSGQHLSKDLHEALEFIKKLSAVIAATHPDAFKGWARGENAPYDLAKAADNFVHQPRSVFPPSTPDGEFTVGDYTLREGMERGKVWIEHESGEGGDFTAAKVEEAIAAFYKEHF